MLRAREERRLTSPLRQSWTLGFELETWQAAALQEWTKAGQRGVVEAATGTGKTVVALAAIERLHRDHGDRLRVAIVVPTKVLADQWRNQLERQLGLPRNLIGEHHSDARVEWRPEQPVLVAVINSARTSLRPVLEGWRKRGHLALVVVDECHRAGSEYNAKIFEGSYDLSLGLSATPERGDWGHEEFVYPGLGRPVYRYQLLDALDDGVLAPVRSVNLYVDFDADEHERWQEMSNHLGTAFRNLMDRYPKLRDVADERLLGEVGKLAKGQDRLALSILKLLADRRELLSSARARTACQRSVLSWLAETGHRALVFHETIAAAEASHQHLARTLRCERASITPSSMASSVRRPWRASGADATRCSSRYEPSTRELMFATPVWPSSPPALALAANASNGSGGCCAMARGRRRWWSPSSCEGRQRRRPWVVKTPSCSVELESATTGGPVLLWTSPSTTTRAPIARERRSCRQTTR
jgi:superfamily II DNA or RNA helicase